MGGKSKAPPPPDYSGVAKASEKSAQLAYDLGKEQLEWAKETYKNDKEIIDRVVGDMLTDADINRDMAAKDRERYETIYQPLEDQLAQEAEDYASPERREREMAKAQAGVAVQMDAARENAQRELEAYGIDPSSTRYAALDIGVRTQQAAAAAAAGNQASDVVDATGRALRSEAINVGRGYPGQIAGQYGTALNAGNSAGGQQLAGTQSGANTMGTNTQYMGLGNQAVGTWGNTLNMGYQNRLDAFKANQESSSGLGSVLGLVGGIGLKAFGLEEGGVVPDPDEGQSGGAIPDTMSPSRGAAVDDVPARLNVGEFVVPDDAVSWFGEKHFYGIIEKANKEREEAKQRTGAIPEIGPAINAPPQYQSADQPTRSAIPQR